MRNLIAIFIVFLFFSCQNDNLEGYWISDDYLGCPTILEIDKKNITVHTLASTWTDYYKYKIKDSCLIIDDLLTNEKGLSSIDTVSYSLTDEILISDGRKFSRLNYDKHYLIDYLNDNYPVVTLPEFDAPFTIRDCSRNYIIIPNPENDILKINLNGNWISNLKDIRFHISSEEWGNGTILLIDKEISYGTLNEIRNFLRFEGIYRLNFIFYNSINNKNDYYSTFGIRIYSYVMSDMEIETFNDTHFQRDSLHVRPPLPPSPELIDFIKYSVISSKLLKVDNDTLKIDKLDEQLTLKHVDLDKLLVLDVPDTIKYATYLKVRLGLEKYIYHYRDSIAMKAFNQSFKDLEVTISDSLEQYTRLRLYEISQLLDVEWVHLEEKYGL